MRILVLGCRGQVGAELVRARWGREVEVTGIAPAPWQASLDRVLDRLVPAGIRLEQHVHGGAA